MKLTKHVGIDPATGQRIALILTVLPNTEDCLVVYTDSLQANIKDDFTHILDSNAGQTATNLADALSRRLYSDSGKNMLQTLHEYRLIIKKSIDDVIMTPTPAYKIPLRTVLVESGLITRPVERVEKFNPHTFNSKAANVGESLGTARNLLIEADLLEQSAKDKREQAYGFAPSLRPGAAAPVDTTESIDIARPPVPEIVPMSPLDLAAAFTMDATGETEKPSE